MSSPRHVKNLAILCVPVSRTLTRTNVRQALPFPSRKHPWTLVHCHYAVMGGFAFDTSNLEQKIFADHRTRLTLSCNGLLELARQEVDLPPDISEEFIRDKSKANGVAKALVCLQALWFCVETLGRLGQRLPISMLELNTFAHALCCVLLYFIWWDKPFNIDQPTLIPVVTYRTQKFCAAMSMLSTANMIKPLNAPFLWVCWNLIVHLIAFHICLN